MPDPTATPTIVVDGKDLPLEKYADLVDLRVEQQLNVPARLELRFRDPDFALLDSTTFSIGDPVEVKVPSGSSDVSVIKAEITSIGAEQHGGDRHELVVTAMDKGHRLANGTKIRTFQNQTYAGVVQSLAGEAGLSADVTANKVTLPYIVQTDTNYAFLSDVCRRLGYDWWVEGTTLHCAPRTKQGAAVTLTAGASLRRFKARYSAVDHTDQVDVQGWDPASQKEITGRAKVTARPKDTQLATTAPLAANGAKAANGAAFNGAMHNGARPVTSQKEADELATALANRSVESQLTGRGETDEGARLKPGTWVKIEGMGTKLSGEYLVTGVEHVFGGGEPLVTRFTVGGADPGGLVDLLAAPRGGAGGWGQLGLVVGIVDNIDDPDKAGRIRLKLPTLSDETTSAWARIVAPGAGKKRGTMFHPEVGDEVLVGFEHGDLRRPFVLGGLHSAKNESSIANGDLIKNGAVVQRGLTSRTGHLFLFDDGDDEPSVLLKVASGKSSLFLGDEKIELEQEGKSILIKSNSASVEIDDAGGVTVKGKKVTLKGDQAVELSAPQVTIKASSKLAMSSGGQAELKGTQVSVNGSAMTEVKGGMVKIN